MTDYYPVILRAVAALETNTFEARRAIYNHARAAQSEQLRNRPFVKKDFDHERLMLEDAISRVEIETTNKRIATGPSPGTRVRPSNIAPIPMTPLPPVYEDKDKTFLARKPLFTVFVETRFATTCSTLRTDREDKKRHKKMLEHNSRIHLATSNSDSFAILAAILRASSR